MTSNMPPLPTDRIRDTTSISTKNLSMDHSLKVKNEGSPRLQSLLGAAGMIGQDRLLDNETSGKKDEESTANTSADSLGSASDLDKQTGDDSPADKMMRFFTGKPCKERSKKSKAIKFPLKLMYVLECGDFADIISWTRSGMSFKVDRPSELEARVLPAIFKDAKFSSFRRKLNRWSFKRNRTAAHFTVSHPLFRRGDFRLCQMMSCSKSDDISLPGPCRNSILHSEAGAILDSQTDVSVPSEARDQQVRPSFERADNAALLSSVANSYRYGNNVIPSQEDNLAYSLRGREGLDMAAAYGMHGDSNPYAALGLPRARLQQQLACDPMLLANRNPTTDALFQRQLLERGLSEIPADVMMELQIANRNQQNVDLLRNLGGGMAGLSPQDIRMDHQQLQLLRERQNLVDNARNFTPSIEEVMLAQQGMQRGFNSQFLPGQEMMLGRQQQPVMEHADRIINDAMDILRHAP